MLLITAYTYAVYCSYFTYLFYILIILRIVKHKEAMKDFSLSLKVKCYG